MHLLPSMNCINWESMIHFWETKYLGFWVLFFVATLWSSQAFSRLYFAFSWSPALKIPKEKSDKIKNYNKSPLICKACPYSLLLQVRWILHQELTNIVCIQFAILDSFTLISPQAHQIATPSNQISIEQICHDWSPIFDYSGQTSSRDITYSCKFRINWD